MNNASAPRLQDFSARQALVQGEAGSLPSTTDARPGVGVQGGTLHMKACSCSCTLEFHRGVISKPAGTLCRASTCPGRGMQSHWHDRWQARGGHTGRHTSHAGAPRTSSGAAASAATLQLVDCPDCCLQSADGDQRSLSSCYAHPESCNSSLQSPFSMAPGCAAPVFPALDKSCKGLSQLGLSKLLLAMAFFSLCCLPMVSHLGSEEGLLGQQLLQVAMPCNAPWPVM